VSQNSVYSFAVVLLSALVGLWIGATAVHFLLDRRLWKEGFDAVLMTSTGILVGASPLLFFHVTNGLERTPRHSSWGEIPFLLVATAQVVLLPAILMGMWFPLLFKRMEGAKEGMARLLGTLTAVNTLGAIAGSLVAGFFLLPWLTVWQAISVVALVYFAVATFFARGWLRLVPILLGFAIVPVLNGLPVLRLDSSAEQTVVDQRQGSHGIVSVIRQKRPGAADNLYLLFNNSYTLGGVASLADHRRETHLPLLMHPDPSSVFVLGVATGITAGAALEHPIQRLVAAELVPDVAKSARDHFSPFNHDLFQDPRAEVVIEDGRNYLFGTRETFDVIVSDIVRPWAAGAGSLFSIEHYRNISSRLAEGGIFVQWLPLFELKAREFDIVLRTMRRVFPEITLWRANFSPRRSVVGLFARNETTPWNPDLLVRNLHRWIERARSPERKREIVEFLASVEAERLYPWDRGPALDEMTRDLHSLAERLPFTFFLGSPSVDEAGEIQSDRRPVIDFISPFPSEPFLVGERLPPFFQRFPIGHGNPPVWSADRLGYAVAGRDYFQALSLLYQGDEEEAARLYQRYLRALRIEGTALDLRGR
jgi:spermidine synthase